MDVDFTWLEDNFFKKTLTEAQKVVLLPKIEVVTVSAGGKIVQQGCTGQALYVIHSGAAHIDCNCNGENIRIGTAHSANLIGEMSFLTATEASATVTARDDCTIYKLSRAAFSQLMKENQELTYTIFAHLLTHTADIIRHMNTEKAAVQHYMAGHRF